MKFATFLENVDLKGILDAISKGDASAFGVLGDWSLDNYGNARAVAGLKEAYRLAEEMVRKRNVVSTEQVAANFRLGIKHFPAVEYRDTVSLAFFNLIKRLVASELCGVADQLPLPERLGHLRRYLLRFCNDVNLITGNARRNALQFAGRIDNMIIMWTYVLDDTTYADLDVNAISNLELIPILQVCEALMSMF